jgi:hypothetical protein
MCPKCRCVTVRRDFDNESAGRRDPLDASSSEFDIMSLAQASASRVFRAFKIDGTKACSQFCV